MTTHGRTWGNKGPGKCETGHGRREMEWDGEAPKAASSAGLLRARKRPPSKNLHRPPHEKDKIFSVVSSETMYGTYEARTASFAGGYL
jgi:hypothetical protein